MPKTKAQKHAIVAAGEKDLKDSKFLVFADFSFTPDEAVKSFRRLARGAKSQFHVIKKSLLGVIMKKQGMEFNPKQYKAQVGTVFTKGDISDIAPVLYKFSKANATFKMLGGFDLSKKETISLETLSAIGKLPSRDVLLGQVLGGLTGSFRKFMYALVKIGEAKVETK